MEWLFWLLIIIVLIVVVGHFGWALIARLLGYRVQMTPVRGAPRATPIPCPVCGGTVRLADGACANCQSAIHLASIAAASSAARAFTQHLDRLLAAELIDEPTHERVLAAHQLATADDPLAADKPQPTESTQDPQAARAVVPLEPIASASAETATGMLPEAPSASQQTSPGDEEYAVARMVAPPPQAGQGGTNIPPYTGGAAGSGAQGSSRVQQFLSSATRPAAPETARPPRRPLSQVLAGFMEQKNIRWGELVGGLLIVGCSVALVVSFWARIAQAPILRFTIFTAVTGALFGLGLYTEHRWKLPATSRGILLIATLLVPLNFLAFAAFSGGTLAWAAQALALVFFAWLVWPSAKVIAPIWPLLLTLGVCAESAATLAMGRLNIAANTAMPMILLALAPIGIYELIGGWMLLRARRWRTIREVGANAVFLLLGIVTFAAAAALGLLMHRAPDTGLALRNMGPLLGLCGLPALGSGLLLWQRVSDPRHARLRIAGAAVGIAGAGMLAAGVALGWPDPASMASAAVIDCVALVALGLAFDIPAAHYLALACLTFAWLLLWARCAGNAAWTSTGPRTLNALLWATGGAALLPLAILQYLAGALLGRPRTRFWSHRPNGAPRNASEHSGSPAAHAAVFQRAAVCVTILNIAIVTWTGFAQPHDPRGATWIYAAYCIAAFLLAWRAAAGGERLAWAGWLLAGAAIVQAFVSWNLTRDPWPAALLIFASLATAAIILRPPRGGKLVRLIARPARWVALCAMAGAIAMVLANLSFARADRIALAFAWSAAIALLVGACEAWPVPWVFGQIALCAAAYAGPIAALMPHRWFTASSAPLLEPWTIQAQACAIVALCLVWQFFRWIWPPVFLAARRTTPSDALANDNLAPESAAQSHALPAHAAGSLPDWVLDRVAPFVALATLLALATYGMWPAIDRELLNPGLTFLATSADAASARAAGIGAWALLALLAIFFLAHLRRAAGKSMDAKAIPSLLIALWAACPLLAAHKSPLLAAGASLRWLAALYLLLVWAGVWLHDRLPAGGRLQPISRSGPGALLPARSIGIVLGLLPVLLFTILPVSRLLWAQPASLPIAPSFFWRCGIAANFAVPITLIALAFLGEAIHERQPRQALVSSIVLCMAATLGDMLRDAPGRIDLSEDAIVGLLQLNAIVMAAYATAWLLIRRILPRAAAHGAALPKSLGGQIIIAIALLASVLVPATWLLAWVPPSSSALIAAAGGGWGWAAVLLTFVAILLHAGERNRLTVRVLAVMALAIVAMIASSINRFFPGGDWLAFHAMLLGDAAAAWGALALAWWITRRSGAPAILGSTVGIESSSDAASPAVLQYQRPDTRAVALPTYLGGQPIRPAAVRAAFWIGIWVALLAVRAMAGDPGAPWWSMGAALAVAGLAIAIACWELRQGFLYPAAALLNLAASMWFVDAGYRSVGGGFVNFAGINAIALAVPGIAWLVLELQVFRARRAGAPGYVRACHRVASVGAILLAAVIGAYVLAARFVAAPAEANLLLAGLAILSAYGLAVAGLWDARSRGGAAGLYVLGLAAICTLLGTVTISREWIAWVFFACIGGFGVLTSALFHQRDRLGRLAEEIGAAGARRQRADQWLPLWNTVIAGVVIAAAASADLTFSRFAGRLMLAIAAVTQAISLALLSREIAGREARAPIESGADSSPLLPHVQNTGEPPVPLAERSSSADLRHWRSSRSSAPSGALMALALGAMLIGWAWTPAPDQLLLDRSAIAFCTFAIFSGIFDLLFHRLAFSDSRFERTFTTVRAFWARLLGEPAAWARAAQSSRWNVAVLAAAALGATFWTQIQLRAGGNAAPLHAVGGWVVGVLVGACAMFLYEALRARTPVGLTDRARRACVYAAEIMLAAALMELRLAEPRWFGGWLISFWPLVVMGIAFAGVGAGEIFRRSGQPLLWQPLERTGILLPLLPVLAWWVAPASRISLAELLLVAFAFYAILAAIRQSLALGALAALAGNGALWDVLAHSSSLGFFQHPQLWLIPGALCVLAAAQLNRDRIPPSTLRAIRYACLLAVYVSSTADIFLTGVARAPWLPLVLAALAIAGMMVGILFRIRPFLFLGALFLLLAVLTMIWFASSELHWTWIWYVAGIITGAAIIATFALFEKKRQQMTELVEGLRQWQ